MHQARFPGNEKARWTVDVFQKGGRPDASGKWVQGTGITLTLDYGRYFARVASDPYVNFSGNHMLRAAFGMRFRAAGPLVAQIVEQSDERRNEHNHAPRNQDGYQYQGGSAQVTHAVIVSRRSPVTCDGEHTPQTHAPLRARYHSDPLPFKRRRCDPVIGSGFIPFG
jgi:hypothetical protein